MNDDDDICVWPDGDYCFFGELEDYRHKSDDYRVILVDTAEYREFCAAEAELF